MADYGQFCPVAKATELVGERWTLLILRELILGTHRFNDFQRALSRISPTLLAKRLNGLEQAGVVVKRRQQGRRGYEYHLTPAGKQLSPIIEHLAVWGMRWTRGQLTESELDVEFLMWDIQRRLQTESLPGGETVLCFTFDNLEKYKSWWLVINDDEVDLCTENPGKEVDLYLNTSVRTLVEVWEGALDVGKALRSASIKTIGNRQLAKSLPEWLGICLYADVQPGDPRLLQMVADDETEKP